MSARDEILATIRRSLGVTGRRRRGAQIVEERLERAPQGRRSRRAGRARAPSGWRSSGAGRGGARHGRRGRLGRRRAAGRRRLPAQPQPAGRRSAWATIARLAAMPWSATTLEHRPRTERRRRSQRRQPRLRRRRRDRHAGHGLGPGQSLDAQLPAGQPHRRRRGEGRRRRLRDGLDEVRFAYGKGGMPRTVNWITGPSRSADIEQTLLLGAHGPRRLHVVVVGA